MSFIALGAPTVTVPSGPLVGLMLDHTPNAYAAHSLHLLNKNYTGPLITVRRSSDDTTLDIGFVAATGRLNTAALLAFAGAGSAYISKWWDQSLNARHLDGFRGTSVSSTVNAMQPRIVNAGVLETMPNGNPAAYFNGSQIMEYNGIARLTEATGNCSIVVLAQPSGSIGSTSRVFTNSNAATAPATSMAFMSSAQSVRWYVNLSTPGVNLDLQPSGIWVADTPIVLGGNAIEGGTSVLHKNAKLIASATTYDFAGTGPARYEIGAQYITGTTLGSPYTGRVETVVTWAAGVDISAAEYELMYFGGIAA